MNASVGSDDQTVLLLLPSRKEMCPLSTAAFTRAQTSRRKLSTDYREALILDCDGALRHIEKIDVLAPWGDSFFRRLASRLTDAWSIRVRLSEPLPLSLDQLKRVLLDCMTSPATLDNMQLDSEDARARFTADIRAARSKSELLELLKLPAPEDALDVL